MLSKIAPAPVLVKPTVVPPVTRPAPPAPAVSAPDTFEPAPRSSFPIPLPDFGDIAEKLIRAVKVSKATRAAEDLWSEPGTNDATGRSGGAVTRNYREVNAPNPAGDAEAKGQLKANRELEAESLEAMSPEQRQQYDVLVEQTQGNPQSRLALQLLAMQGKLTEGPTASDGQTLLSQLHTAATQPNAAGIDTRTLVCDLVRELATPSAIHQGSKGTCGPTTVQIKLAEDNPAEYARIVAGLASETGEVQLANGETIRREEGTATDDFSGRTQSSRLWQAAMMELGNGDASYDNGTDAHTLDGETTGGLGGSQINDMMEAVFGSSYETEEVSGMSLEDRTARISDIEEALKRGDSVPIAIGAGEATDGSTGCHWVNVTRIEGDKVYYQNPWGQEECMSRDELAQRLRAASIPS